MKISELRKIIKSEILNEGFADDFSKFKDDHKNYTDKLKGKASKLKERKTQIDYREIFGAIGGSHFHWINLHAIFYKIFLCDWFLENKDEFIKTFNERINNK